MAASALVTCRVSNWCWCGLGTEKSIPDLEKCSRQVTSFASERQLESHLANSRIGDARDFPKCRSIRGGAGIIRIDVVEHVEKFTAELQGYAFSQRKVFR